MVDCEVQPDEETIVGVLEGVSLASESEKLELLQNAISNLSEFDL